jgi:hypothetical protein
MHRPRPLFRLGKKTLRMSSCFQSPTKTCKNARNYSVIWVLKIPLDVQKTTKQRFRGPFPEPKGANFSRPQVKHFLGCKKSTKSNTCGSLFTCSGALLFSSTKTAKFQNPSISGHGAFACILYHVLTKEIHRQNLQRHIFSPYVLDNL